MFYKKCKPFAHAGGEGWGGGHAAREDLCARKDLQAAKISFLPGESFYEGIRMSEGVVYLPGKFLKVIRNVTLTVTNSEQT